MIKISDEERKEWLRQIENNTFEGLEEGIKAFSLPSLISEQDNKIKDNILTYKEGTFMSSSLKIHKGMFIHEKRMQRKTVKDILKNDNYFLFVERKDN